MDRCIAYLTYQAPLPLDRELEEKMGKWIYGCDICQEVCPLNKSIRQEYEPLPYLEEIAHLLTPQELSIMDSKRYAEVVYPLFYYIPPDEIDRWHRNAKRSLRLTSL
jgi:epoxyqueuosine reductase